MTRDLASRSCADKAERDVKLASKKKKLEDQFKEHKAKLRKELQIER